MNINILKKSYKDNCQCIKLITENKNNDVMIYKPHHWKHTTSLETGEVGEEESFDVVMGCDGAYSSLRSQMMKNCR